MASINFHDHEIVQQSPKDYVELTFSPKKILSAWRHSLFACELLDQDGHVKKTEDMRDMALEKYLSVLDSVKKMESIPKPVLGIGMMDNVEIGIGREIIAIATTHNLEQIPVHVRQAQADEIIKLI